MRNMSYDSLEVVLESDMYNDEEIVVAKAMVLQRDDEYDYVILNLATSEIDEFVFDEPTALNKYSKKLYYTGAMGYFVKEQNNYVHIESNKKLSESEYNKVSENINSELEKTTKNLNCKKTNNETTLSLTNIDPYSGFYKWAYIYENNLKNNYTLTACKYLKGTTRRGVSYVEEPDETQLNFYNQTAFNNESGTDNSCGPTAITNMMIWFDYMKIPNISGVNNILIDGSPFKTFDKFRELTFHSSDNGTLNWIYQNAMIRYFEAQGYKNYDFIRTSAFGDYIECLNNNNPILTSLHINKWRHAVLTTGYEYYTSNSGQTPKYNCYLRVVDGWYTYYDDDEEAEYDDLDPNHNYSNGGKFIDFFGFWNITSFGVSI